MYHICKNIKDLRIYRNLSIEELAMKAEVSPAFIKSIEENNINFSIELLIKIASALNCTLDIIFMPQ